MMIVSRNCRTLTILPKTLKSWSWLWTTNTRNYTNRNLLSLRDRGLVSDYFPNNSKEIIDLFNGGPQIVYAGFDPTASSLHVGNLAVIMLLLHAQRGGHKIIGLVGGATGRIGDPSGRSAERPILNSETIDSNIKGITECLQTVFNNHEKYFWDSKNRTEPLAPLKILNNSTWYENLSALELIGKVGKHMRLGQMLSRQSVASRLSQDQPISYTEFSYQVFQSYDWYWLMKNEGVRIQVGGNDQMGNIVSGHDLISRLTGTQVYGLTVPLITSETGNKYGKTAGNAIWLQPSQTSPFELYQFFLRTEDSRVESLLRQFTFLQESEIEAIMKKQIKAPEKHHAQIALAQSVTKLVHGEIGLQNAENATRALYSQDLQSLSSLKFDEIKTLFTSPTGTVGTAILNLEPGTTILDMVMAAGCFKTKNDAIRIIDAGGLSLNYQRIRNFEEAIVPGVHILPNHLSLARVGKKNYYVIQWKH